MNTTETLISVLQILIAVYPDLQSLITSIINEIKNTGSSSPESIAQLQEALNAARQADINSENTNINILNSTSN